MPETSIGGPGGALPDTLWTEVLRAGGDTPRAKAALERLVSRYWKPVYFFLRRRGTGVEDAKDLTQAFFADLLERGAIAQADPARGRFRSWLLACLRNFAADQADKARAARRGGEARFVAADAESEYVRDLPSEGPTPEEAFHRKWAMDLLREAIASLDEKWRSLLKDPNADPRRAFEARAALKQALLARIRDTVGSAREAEEELRELLRDFSG
jgi:RNA polymerase sigma-70 factor (ECF subfamily)